MADGLFDVHRILPFGQPLGDAPVPEVVLAEFFSQTSSHHGVLKCPSKCGDSLTGLVVSPPRDVVYQPRRALSVVHGKPEAGEVFAQGSLKP